MTAIQTQPQTRTRPLASAAKRPVWLVGIAAAFAGAVVTEVFALGARAIDVPMKVASPGGDNAVEIPVGGFAPGVLFWSVVGIVLAVALARWAKRPSRTFVVTTVALTAVSLVPPFTTADTATSTQVLLALTHLVAAAVIIPIIARRLPDSR